VQLIHLGLRCSLLLPASANKGPLVSTATHYPLSKWT